MKNFTVTERPASGRRRKRPRKHTHAAKVSNGCDRNTIDGAESITSTPVAMAPWIHDHTDGRHKFIVNMTRPQNISEYRPKRFLLPLLAAVLLLATTTIVAADDGLHGEASRREHKTLQPAAAAASYMYRSAVRTEDDPTNTNTNTTPKKKKKKTNLNRRRKRCSNSLLSLKCKLCKRKTRQAFNQVKCETAETITQYYGADDAKTSWNCDVRFKKCKRRAFIRGCRQNGREAYGNCEMDELVREEAEPELNVKSSFDNCDDLEEEEFYESIVSEIVTDCNETVTLSDQLNDAYQEYLQSLENCGYENDEGDLFDGCGVPRNVDSASVYDVEAEPCYDDFQTTVHWGGGGKDRNLQSKKKKKRRRKNRLKLRAKKTGKCRRCADRSKAQKISDSIGGRTRRFLRDVVVAARTVAAERHLTAAPETCLANERGLERTLQDIQVPDLLETLSRYDVGFEPLEASLTGVVECAPTSDACLGSSGECCGSSGCTCTSDQISEANCLAGIYLANGTNLPCFLSSQGTYSEATTNLCCSVTPRIDECGAECPTPEPSSRPSAAPSLRPSSAPSKPCDLEFSTFLSAIEDNVDGGGESGLEVLVTVTIFNQCAFPSQVTALSAQICAGCTKIIDGQTYTGGDCGPDITFVESVSPSVIDGKSEAEASVNLQSINLQALESQGLECDLYAKVSYEGKTIEGPLQEFAGNKTVYGTAYDL